MFKPSERCPFCLSKGTVEVLENDTWEYLDRNQRSFEVSGITCFHCKSCGEKSVNGEMDRLNHPKILDARRISESLLSSEDIKRILGKAKEALPIAESQLEAILGIGPKSFARWKAGKVSQSPAADALLRLIDKDPSNIVYLAQQRGVDVSARKRGRPASPLASHPPAPRKPAGRPRGRKKA